MGARTDIHSQSRLHNEDTPVLPDQTKSSNKTRTIWRNIYIFIFFTVSAVYGLYLAITDMKWQTFLFVCLLLLGTRVGVTSGVHRLWSHRAYKARLPLRIILMLLFTLAFEGKLLTWARDHRAHHKYQDTDADPYNARRGLWFSHMGWLLQSKHPAVIEKGKGVDVSDLRSDGVVMFQTRYYWMLLLLVSILLPLVTPVICWGESWSTSWYVVVCLRVVLSNHSTWFINSIAHKYGTRPFDKNVFARENRLAMVVTLGEGWHNFHHAFPWDYKASDLNYSLNFNTGLINFFARLGWAYDLKTVSAELVHRRALRTGDGSLGAVWGWQDKQLSELDKAETDITRGATCAHESS